MITKQQRIEVFNKYNGHCAYCGCELTKGFHVDHIVPKVRKLQKHHDLTDHDEMSNLNPACKECNTYKGGYSLELYRTLLSQMLNDKLEYLFKSKTKMREAINYGVVTLAKWDGKFYFEKLKEGNPIIAQVYSATVPESNTIDFKTNY